MYEFSNLRVSLIFGITNSIFGTFLSLLLIYINLKHRVEIKKSRRRSNTTLLLVICSDFAFHVLVGIPFFASYLYMDRLIEAGDFWCHLTGVLTLLTYGSSNISICLCSYERYIVLVRGSSLPVRRLIIIYAFAMVFCVGTAAFLPIFLGVGFAPTSSHMWCSPFRHPAFDHDLNIPDYYYFLNTGLSIAVMAPGLVYIGITYWRIYRHISSTTTKAKRDMLPQEESSAQGNHREISIFYKISIIAGSSLLLWSPIMFEITLEAMLGIRMPPLLDNIILSVLLLNPNVNSLLFLILIRHYNAWARDTCYQIWSFLWPF